MEPPSNLPPLPDSGCELNVDKPSKKILYVPIILAYHLQVQVFFTSSLGLDLAPSRIIPLLQSINLAHPPTTTYNLTIRKDTWGIEQRSVDAVDRIE